MFLGSGGAFESLLAPCCAARCFVRFVRFVVLFACACVMLCCEGVRISGWRTQNDR